MIEFAKSPDWHEERRRGLGASDAPIVMGVGLITRLDLWKQKLGLDNGAIVTPAMEMGNFYEDGVAARFASLNPTVTIRRQRLAVRHKRYPFLFAHLDRRGKDAQGGRFPLEVKTASFEGEWGEANTDQIPHYYVPQVQHQLACTGDDYARVAVGFGTGYDRYRDYIVPRDDEYIENELLPALLTFWDLVQRRIQPEPITLEETLQRYPKAKGTVTATVDIVDAVKALADARKRKSKAESDEKAARNIIAPYMGEAETLTYEGRTILTFSTCSTGVRINSEALKAAQPAIFEEFSSEGSTRKMLVK